MRTLRPALLRAGLLATLATPRAGHAQIPYHVFDDRTQVGSLHFTFPDGRSFPESRLLAHMVLSPPGPLSGVQDALSFLPFISDPRPHPFTVLDLQRDVARIRRFYAENGFIGTDIRYEVDFDAKNDRVAIDMIVTEGRAIRVRTLRFTTPDGGDPASALPDSLRSAWSDFDHHHGAPVGERFTEAMRSGIVGDVLDWWRNRGWAFAQARAETAIDSAQAAVDLTVRMDPGPRARIGTVETEGNHGVSDDLILRALPFHQGEWFSAERLAEGQRRLFGLDLFRLVLVDVPQQPRDSTVRVRVRVEENPPRLLTGEAGYVSAGGGLTGSVQWANRNFGGSARSLRTTTTFQTGILSLVDPPEKQYGLTVGYRRPFTFHPRMTLDVAPYGRYRDDRIDRSWEVGAETSLIYELGPYRFLTLQHRYSSRRILDYRLGSANAVDLQTLIRLAGEGALDSLLAHRIDRSTFSLSATIGRFDPTSPARALQASPTAEVTSPAALNAIEFTHVELPVLGYLPLGHGFALATRGRFGRVYPYGKTLRGDSVAGVLQAVRLRDVLLTAGGTGSVRGWGNGLLGPKFPNLAFTDSAQTVTDGYVPAGGLARATASVELRTPFPGLSDRWGLHAFLDAGRVWTPDMRFRGQDPYGEQRWFYGAGGGVDISTIVGPIRIGVGYKLNPSPLDLRDAKAVFQAISEGRPVSSVPADWKRRIHIHVALGQVF